MTPGNLHSVEVKRAPAAEASANCIDHSSKMDTESDHPCTRKPSPTKIGFRLKLPILNGIWEKLSLFYAALSPGNLHSVKVKQRIATELSEHEV